jgi:hypothetical protein
MVQFIIVSFLRYIEELVAINVTFMRNRKSHYEYIINKNSNYETKDFQGT